MATNTAETTVFPPRKWYRKVPLISTIPIKKRVSEATPEDVGKESKAEAVSLPLPESSAKWLSLLFFQWLAPLLRTGYTRPLQADDLYTLPANRQATAHADLLERSWAARLAQNRHRRKSLSNTTILALALNDVCLRRFWFGGLFKLLGDLTQMLAPLLVRFTIARLASPSPAAAFGFVAGLFAILVVSVTANVHGFHRSYTTGVLLRAALLHTIYRRATSTERGHGGVGKLMSLMSADVTRVDFVCGSFHSAWTSILQIALCFALTVWTMGYSALPGFALLVLLYPLQTFMMGRLLQLRRKSMPSTDARVKAVMEAVATIRLVKTNAYEKSLLSRIGQLRGTEVGFIRKRMLLRALNTAVSYTAPTIAAVLAIVCYGATQGEWRADVVFSSLTFFTLLRTPLMALPAAVSAIADARAALERLATFILASDTASDADSGTDKSLEPPKLRYSPLGDASQPVVVVEDATFVHHDEYTAQHDKSLQPPQLSQRLTISSLIVKRHQLVCIVGPVASGKTSLLRALLGDMQPLHSPTSTISLNATSLAYVPQTAWLLSETIRENIVFGRAFDAAWYHTVLSRCCLHRDLEQLPDGDMTVVGELGVSLSGGQKQRISIARAVYGRSPLLLLDDCFSALDADVSASVFTSVVKQTRRTDDTTSVVLVTHSMVLAREADWVVYMESGGIVEQGPYADLVERKGPFSSFVVGQDTSKDTQTSEAADEQPGEDPQAGKEPDLAARRKEIMQQEERLIGSVSANTYLRYVMMGNAYITVPLLIVSIILYQGTSIVSALWLTWWGDGKYALSITEAGYMAGYAVFGVGQSLGLFCMSATFALFCFYCSNRLHHAALTRTLLAPLAFFDTTPQGRITHRFSKDVDAVDNVVGETLRLFLSTAMQALGTIILVAIVLPPFVAIAAVMLLAYTWTGMYYRPSARELRRLTALLRSRIYEHFGESLAGLTTLRAFGAVGRFVEDNARRIDAENKAYWLSVAAQRWLNLRLDLCGAVLVLVSGLLVVALRGTLSVSAGGLVLSYVVTAQAVFGNMIRQSAELENNMNAVERLLHYAFNLPQEPVHEAGGDDKLKAQGWPTQGRIEYRALTLSHRPGLPPALRDVTLDIKPGEKVGIVGRTGAGKTTVVSALLRNTEPTSGEISIDGVSIHNIGLRLLRSSLSVISQDAVLLTGTIRYNLDPFQKYDDVWLHQCLDRVTVTSPSVQEKQQGELLTLDFQVAENGANLSSGQRSLLSIARALVRQSKIVILDEATASIDGRADAQLQAMLTEVLGDATVLTVAHRLDTIIATCDRVVVMEAGRVAEAGGIAELWTRNDGLFRKLCDTADVKMKVPAIDTQ